MLCCANDESSFEPTLDETGTCSLLADTLVKELFEDAREALGLFEDQTGSKAELYLLEPPSLAFLFELEIRGEVPLDTLPKALPVLLCWKVAGVELDLFI